jgi:hypothetical protein
MTDIARLIAESYEDATEAKRRMERGLRALYLEAPESVAGGVIRLVHAREAELIAQLRADHPEGGAEPPALTAARIKEMAQAPDVRYAVKKRGVPDDVHALYAASGHSVEDAKQIITALRGLGWVLTHRENKSPIISSAPTAPGPEGGTAQTERQAFEEWFGSPLRQEGQPSVDRFARNAYDEYKDRAIQFCWEGWEGRSNYAPVAPGPKGEAAMNGQELERVIHRLMEKDQASVFALLDIATERLRQIEGEGWTLEHDDNHERGTMAMAAAAYAYNSAVCDLSRKDNRASAPAWWPWDFRWWKPSSRARDRVKAGALLVAEMSRWLRSAPVAPGPGALEEGA